MTVDVIQSIIATASFFTGLLIGGGLVLLGIWIGRR